LIHFGTGGDITIQTRKESVRFLSISGKPIQEPVAWRGPIVMNTQAKLRQAVRDLQNNSFIKQAH
jgi:quercetin 2,3-dioxygenase